MRVIEKGNVKAENYDIRITETDGKVYCYRFFQLVDGEYVIYVKNPFNMKGVVTVLWEDLHIKVREAHYNKLYPKDNLDDYEKKCFLYGKQKADEEKRIADERAKEKEEFMQNIDLHTLSLSYTMAGIIYDKIGSYNKVEAVYNKWPTANYIVDDKYFIITHGFNVVSIEEKEAYEARRKNWGRRVGEIARLAGTSYDMATVVANIPETDKAVEILKKIKEIINSEKFTSYALYLNDNSFFKMEIKIWLYDKLRQYNIGTDYCRKLNMSEKFYNSVEQILRNKK